MALNNKFVLLLATLSAVLLTSSCKMSYKMNGSWIDYNKTKTISIATFANTAELVYPPFAVDFSQALRDTYMKNTRLQVLNKNGDMQLEGEITEYYLTPLAISTDNYASQTKLTVTINVRYTSKANQADDFERKYSALRTFHSSEMLTNVQDALLKEINEEICEKIFNDTAGKW